MDKLFVLLAIVGAVSGAEWNYNFSGPYGPNHWGTLFPKCNGSKQSPIDIITKNVKYDKTLGQLSFNNYAKTPAGAKIRVKNNGHTFQVDFLNSNTFFVNGGGLGVNFSTAQFHMHWGEDTKHGAEHLIDSERNAACIHIVSYNTKYADLATAADKDDGLAVIGVLLGVGEAHAGLSKVFKYIKNITNVGNVTDIDQDFTLSAMLPSNKDFYRYKGSLTTPKCYESVQWSVMKTKMTISEAQLKELRTLKEHDGKTVITDNYRHIHQPLNGRVVSSNFGRLVSGSTQVAGAFIGIAIAILLVALASLE